MTTQDTLKEIEGRLKKATPGPWVAKDGDSMELLMDGDCQMCDLTYYPWTPDRFEDWEFIAHAHEDVAALLAEVRRLQPQDGAGENTT